MNNVGRLPKQAVECNEGAPIASSGMKRLWSSSGMKRLWGRNFSASAQRVSPPARILLVVLLCAQIMFLAILRLGPSTSTWKGQGAGSSLQASANPHFTLTRKSVVSADMSMDSPAFSDKESKASSKPASSVPKKSAHRKEKPTSSEKTKGEKMLMKEGIQSETAEIDNVAEMDKPKGYGKTDQEAGSSRSAQEQSDDLLPSVGDRFLTDTSVKESFSVDANAGDDDSPSDTSIKEETKQEEPKETLQEEGSSVAVDASSEEPSFSSMRKAKENRRKKRKHGRKATKIKQVVAETEQEQGESGESTSPVEESLENLSKKEDRKALSAEKVEAAAIDTNPEFESTMQEEQPVIVEEASKNVGTMIELDEEKQPPEKEQQAPSAEEKQPPEKEQQAPSAEKVDEAAVKENNPSKQFASESATSITKSADEERSVKELQATSEEKESKQDLSKEEPVVLEQKALEETSSSECRYGYMYVYDLPPAFNHDIIFNCTALNPWFNVCPTLSNGGLGESLGKDSPLGQEGSWYASDHFTAEIVFHNRILQHACLTDKMEVASAFYVPFYGGLDVGRYLHAGASIENRDGLSNQFVDWLIEQPAWKKSGGIDHFMTVGRITWDFRRAREEDWGSGFFTKPAMTNITKLLIERNPWDSKEMGVPYPTNFHPQSDADLIAWQKHIRGLKRNNLFSFAGAPRDKFPNDFRRILFDQCSQVEQCRSLDCSNGACDNNQKAMEFFMDSTFCLQPRGDSFTRRSTFDCLLAGSIPVFFWRRSAYMQYEWHLPADEGSYSVFISKQDVRNGTKIGDVLKAIAPEKVQSMQEAVIQLIPKVVYAASGFAIKEKDAFDVAMEGVMRSLKGPQVSAQ